MVRHWHRLHGEAVGAPSLKVRNARLDGALGRWQPCTWQEVGTGWFLPTEAFPWIGLKPWARRRDQILKHVISIKAFIVMMPSYIDHFNGPSCFQTLAASSLCCNGGRGKGPYCPQAPTCHMRTGVDWIYGEGVWSCSPGSFSSCW